MTSCLYTCLRFLPENLVIAMERSDRSNLLANRSPHCVRDDNLYYARNDKKQDGRVVLKASRHDKLFVHLPAVLARGSCHCDGT